MIIPTRKKAWKAVLSILLALTFVLASAPAILGLSSFTIEDIDLDAPMNPDYIRWLEGEDFGGGVPPQYVTYFQPPLRPTRASYPSVYDARTTYNTGVKDQGSLGTCWAFASNAILEAYIKKNFGGNPDFSEQHMRYALSDDGGNTYGFHRTNGSGGNAKYAGAYWTRQAIPGPVLEGDMPYNTLTTALASSNYESKVRQGLVTGITYFPDLAYPATPGSETTGTYRNMLKQAVMDSGAVQISYYSDQTTAAGSSSGYNTLSGGMKTYYNSSNTTTNHAVTIVGWDDSYPAANFLGSPGYVFCALSIAHFWRRRNCFLCAAHTSRSQALPAITQDLHAKGLPFL